MLTRLRTKGKSGDGRSAIAAKTQELQGILEVRWWRWRHHFLEARRLQLQQRRDERR